MTEIILPIIEETDYEVFFDDSVNIYYVYYKKKKSLIKVKNIQEALDIIDLNEEIVV